MYHQANKKILAPFTSGTSGTFKRRLTALDSSIASLPTNKVSRQRHPHRGFTLVELLVVIVIIAMLAALLVPAVMVAMGRAKQARIKSEIDMLHMAVMKYKSEFGAIPPSANDNGRVLMHLRRLFPRTNTTYYTTTTNNNIPPTCLKGLFSNTNFISPNNQFILRSDTALAYWLSGYSASSTTPFSSPLVPIYDFDRSRFESDAGGFTGRFHSPGQSEGGFYYYISSANYYTTSNNNIFATQGVEFDPSTNIETTAPRTNPGEDANNNGVLDLGEDANNNGVLDYGLPFNPTTFQILHPGRDEQTGTLPTQEDDLSNFWPGTRKDFAEYLRDKQ